MVEHLLTKLKALSSNPSIAQTAKNKQTKKQG
jgi:hypothetical protein